MSDFGANIFDDQTPQRPERGSQPAAPTPSPAPSAETSIETAPPETVNPETVSPEAASSPPRRERRRSRSQQSPPEAHPEPTRRPPASRDSNPWHEQDPTPTVDAPRRAPARDDDAADEQATDEHRAPRRESFAPRAERHAPRDLQRDDRRDDRHDDRHDDRREARRDDRRPAARDVQPHRRHEARPGHRSQRDEHTERRPHHSEHRDRPDRRQQPAGSGEPRQAGAPRSAAAATDKVVLLVDLDALRTGASTRGVELAWNRLQRGLARGRVVAGATAFATEARKVPAGFTMLAPGGDFAAGVELAATAFAGASAAACVLLAPVTPAFTVLARALRARGVRVELADFEASQAHDLPVHALGKDCLFVP